MIGVDFLNQLKKFDLILQKRITSSFIGSKESLSSGHGQVLRDHILYSPGEDIRTIDWNIYARTDKLFVKRYEEDRNLTVHIVIDFSASMGFKSNKFSKAEFASMIALGFAYIALRNNESFVISTFSNKLEIFRPKKGRAHLMDLVDFLNNKKPSGTTDIKDSIFSYKRIISSRSLVVIISDFLYSLDDIKDVLFRLKNSDIRLIQVLDPVEVDLDLDGDYLLRDAETKDNMRTFIGTFVRKNYIDRMTQHRQDLMNVSDQAKSKFFSVSTDKNIFDIFYNILR